MAETESCCEMHSYPGQHLAYCSYNEHTRIVGVVWADHGGFSEAVLHCQLSMLLCKLVSSMMGVFGTKE